MQISPNSIDLLKEQATGFFRPDSKASIFFAKKNFSAKMRIKMYRILARKEKNGEKLKDAITSLKARAQKKGKTSASYIVLYNLLESIESGQPISVGFAPFIPVTETMVIQAGVDSANLHVALMTCVDLIETNQKMKAAVVKAVAYPLILTVVLSFALYQIGVKAMPNIVMMVDPSRLFGPAKGLYLLSNLMQTSFTFFLFGGGIFLILLIIFTFPLWTGRLRAKFDKIPPWSVYRLVTGSGWLLALSSLINSGVGMLQAINMMNTVIGNKNRWILERTEACAFSISKGIGLGKSLAEYGYNFPDEDIVDEIIECEHLPNFESILSNMGKEQISDILERVEQSSGILNITLFLSFAGLLMWIFAGVAQIMGTLSGINIF